MFFHVIVGDQGYLARAQRIRALRVSIRLRYIQKMEGRDRRAQCIGRCPCASGIGGPVFAMKLSSDRKGVVLRRLGRSLSFRISMSLFSFPVHHKKNRTRVDRTLSRRTFHALNFFASIMCMAVPDWLLVDDMQRAIHIPSKPTRSRW